MKQIKIMFSKLLSYKKSHAHDTCNVNNYMYIVCLLKLCSVYIDDLFDHLIKSQIIYQKDNVCVNHVMYTDAICLMAPSPAVLQKLVN